MDKKKVSEAFSLTNMVIGCFNQEAASWLELDNLLLDKAIDLVAGIPLRKFKKYLEGEKKVEEELGGSIHLSDKLFGNKKKAEENGMRIYELVTSVDSSRKIDYFVNATRAFLLDAIDKMTFFRVFNAINSTQIEDLEFLKNNALKGETFYGGIQIIALASSGLMILTDEDYNRGAEEQGYNVSTLGHMVDCFALSFDDDDRIKWYKTHGILQQEFHIPHHELVLEEGTLHINKV